MKGLIALASGLLFGLGLAVGGMLEPARVVGFLDVGGRWDPTLAFVMAAALAVHALALRAMRWRRRPILDIRFHLPRELRIDRRLVLGSAIFGVGWGLSGYCPGPAVVTVGAGLPLGLTFALAMAGGSLLARRWTT